MIINKNLQNQYTEYVHDKYNLQITLQSMFMINKTYKSIYRVCLW